MQLFDPRKFFRKQSKPKQQVQRSMPMANVVRARYDAAQTTAENARHWAMADAMSADCAASADIRKKLRERARYEVANNSYAKGIVLTLANDCIGTGPRLQLLPNTTLSTARSKTPLPSGAKRSAWHPSCVPCAWPRAQTAKRSVF